MAHPKGLLMERLKKQGVAPEFRSANTGPDHEPTFLTDVVVNGEVYGTGQGSTKREAERLAAEEALAYLDRNPLELAGAPGAESPRAKGGKAAQAEQDRPKGQAAPKPDARQAGPKPDARPAGPKPDARPAARSEAKSGARTVERETTAEPQLAADTQEERFEGPWPVFESLLAGIVEVAGERVDVDLKGEEARTAIRDFTLELYKDLLEDLGDIVEDGEPDD